MTSLAGGLLLAAVGSIAWSFSGIESATHKRVSRVSPFAEQGNDSSNGSEFSDAELNVPLRRPLIDPPPPKPRPIAPRVTPAPPAPTLELTLVGTIVDPGNSLAIIADTAGAFDVRGVGESLELTPAGVSVTRIDSEQVELQYRGKTSTVKLDRDFKKKTKAERRGGKVRRSNR